MPSLMMVNPHKRRKAPTKKRKRTTMRVRAHAIKRRRNPIKRTSKMMDLIMGSAVGAGGAIATDVILAKLPIPENLKSGTALPAVKGGLSIAIGMIVSKFGKNKKIGEQLAQGGLTVALHDMAKPMLSGMVPGLSGYDDGDLRGYESLMGDDIDDFEGDSIIGAGMSGMDDFTDEVDEL